MNPHFWTQGGRGPACWFQLPVLRSSATGIKRFQGKCNRFSKNGPVHEENRVLIFETISILLLFY